MPEVRIEQIVGRDTFFGGFIEQVEHVGYQLDSSQCPERNRSRPLTEEERAILQRELEAEATVRPDART